MKAMILLLTKFCIIGAKHGFVSVMAVMGSGGHTQEMMALLSHLNVGKSNGKYSPITLIVANNDMLSVEKVTKLRQTLPDCEVKTITRSRSVGQSYITSLITTFISLIQSMIIVITVRPQLLICNGPGVCLPICLAATLLPTNVCIVFVESFCRTECLSLSGKILYYLAICDHFLVQWPQLQRKYQRSTYLGLLV
ncbi:UDP-N-acetylglucosamine transferase subunit ALG14 homolog [Oppia nitens]|uniref:UDP-N-acetylglucosamine transferase subunit ALG14 homolog n=1 Tax=Oppia nitens TaxID=1686743 RepID=UPI0023DAB07B|nr:UDP-N-acetylglucosamine transferase subunit ALG14 homolog [Oppia nitens]